MRKVDENITTTFLSNQRLLRKDIGSLYEVRKRSFENLIQRRNLCNFFFEELLSKKDRGYKMGEVELEFLESVTRDLESLEFFDLFRRRQAFRRFFFYFLYVVFKKVFFFFSRIRSFIEIFFLFFFFSGVWLDFFF
jgi:hypothetical protein